jgi:methoxymalonate biosynthesis protein
LARGDVIAGFAATEPGAGTDLSAVATRVDQAGGGLSVSGRKVWVTFGEIADVFLVLGLERGLPVAVLVEADRPGVHRTVVRDQLGLRAARLAEVRFDDVRVPERNRVAPAGFGLSHVVATALDHGRLTVAYGCAGMAEACLDDAVVHASTRTQASVRLSEHQVVRAQLGRSLAAVSAAHQLCDRAARSREERSPDAIADTFMAKYVAARCAATVSADAVQTMGAAGCAPTSRVARFYRDAKVMQIIEGTDHVAELHLGEHALRRAAGREEIPA